MPTIQKFPNTKSVVCFGDSITFTAATRANRGYPSILDEMLFADGFTVGNQGVSGGGFQNAIDIYQAYYKGRGIWAACILVGVNDIAGGASAATVYAGINALIQEMLTDNVKVCVSTILPWKNGGGWTAPRQTITETVNAQLLALNGTNPNLLVLDGYAAFGDIDDPALLARSAQEVTADYLHLGSYGSQLLAEMMFEGIKGVFVWLNSLDSATLVLPRLGSTYGWPT